MIRKPANRSKRFIGFHPAPGPLDQRNLRRFDVEIKLSEMNPSDQITIRTQFSDYSFRVTNPVQCRGFLSGGPLGNQPHDASLAGVILPASSAREPSRLETGYRAVFLIAGNGFRRLTTSIITEITVAQTRTDVC